jgi:hypothetical protein
MHDGVHDDDASSADAAERTEHTARKSRSGGMPASNPGCTRGAQKHFSGTKPRRESGQGAHCLRLPCQPMLEETGNAAVSGNFPRRYYPDRVQRDSLSLAARFSVLSRRQTRAEAPLFRHRSLKHKSETTRKPGKAGGPVPTKTDGLPFRSRCAHSGTMPRTPIRLGWSAGWSAAHAYGKRLAVALNG